MAVEVLSPGTESYDRDKKRDQYSRIASLREYVLVGSERARIEVWERSGADWVYKVAGKGDQVDLRSVGCTVQVTELYDLAGVAVS